MASSTAARSMVALLIVAVGTRLGQTQPPGTVPSDPSAAQLEARMLRNPRQITFEGQCGEGYFSPDGSKILFQSIRGDHPFYQIYLKDLATGAERIVSTGAGRTTCSYFHPKKPRILFASSHLDPKREETAEAERQKLADQRKHPQRRRGYEWSFDPFMDLFEADLDGGNLVRITNAPGYDAEGAYSPDGSKIVFCSFRDGNGEIYVMNADGTEPRRLTNAPGYDGGPFFSPDGSRIIYRGEVDKPDYLQIFVMNADGSQRRQLTKNDAVNWGPYWHPDGKHIIFSTSLHGHYNYELYLMNVETAALQRVTYTPGADVLPVFDATGTRLMWTSKRGKNRAGELSSQLWMAEWTFPTASDVSAADR